MKMFRIDHIIIKSIMEFENGCQNPIIFLASAAVTPLIRKTKFLSKRSENYRTISQLPLISKVLEKIVSGQMLQHMSLNDLHEPLQSAYKPGHSTKTAILRVKNDMYWCNNSF